MIRPTRRQRLQLQLLSGCAQETVDGFFDPERRQRLREASIRRISDAANQLGIHLGSEPQSAA